MYLARCKSCRIECILYCEDIEPPFLCPLCDKSLKYRWLYVYGPLSARPDTKVEKLPTGGSISTGKIAIKEGNYTITSECCDICGVPGGPYTPFRIGHTHYAACERCYEGLNLVRLKQTKFSSYR